MTTTKIHNGYLSYKNFFNQFSNIVWQKRWFKSSETFKDDEMYIKLFYIAGDILKNESNT